MPYSVGGAGGAVASRIGRELQTRMALDYQARPSSVSVSARARS